MMAERVQKGGLRGVLFVALAVSGVGCGAGGSVNSDPLTHRLGESTSTVQTVESSLLNRAFLIHGLDPGPSQELGRITGAVADGHMDASVAREIQTVLRQPDKPYVAPLKVLGRLTAITATAHKAAIPSSMTSGSSKPIRAFVSDWNAYTSLVARGLDQEVAKFRNGLALKDPMMLFLRQSRDAFLAQDRTAYAAARSTLIAAVKRLGGAGGINLSGPPPAFTGESAAFDKLLHDANSSDEVHRLVNAVIHDYPGSLFAQRFSR